MSSMNEAPARSIPIYEDFFCDQELFKSLREAGAPTQQDPGSKPKIQRVPIMLRDHKYFEKYYEPRAVALGPIHHGNPRCALAEKFKLALTAKFIEDSGQPAEELHRIIGDNIKMLRDCYEEEVTVSYTDQALIKLLFLDGCSTLQFIYSFINQKLTSFKIKRDQVAFAQQDLFLLENQLPFQLLKLLMRSSTKEDELWRAVGELVQQKMVKKPKGRGPYQLIEEPNKEDPTHLLHLLRTQLLGPLKFEPTNKEDHQPYFRNIQELKAAGIHFRPSKESFLQEISFTSLGFTGFLYLPQISVDDSMGPRFLNLIAYEMCPDFHNDFGVTSYIAFLDSLIDNADDVKQLRLKKVLNNLLGSDEEVAQLFNEIGTDLVPNIDRYWVVKYKLEKHYNSRWKTWMAQFCHEHFNSPWSILAFIGVLAALGLSGIQTWYTIKSPPSPCDDVCQYLKNQLNIKIK